MYKKIIFRIISVLIFLVSSCSVVKFFVNNLYDPRSEDAASNYAPKNLTASDGIDTKIILNWDESPYAEKYKIYRAETAIGTFSECGESSVNSYNDEYSGLIIGQNYFYKVKAVLKTGIETDFSNVDAGSRISAGQVATPAFNYNTNIYYYDFGVTIECTTPAAVIRYTTDGSDPTTDSTLYTGTVNILQTRTLKAIAYRTGWLASNIASATYTMKVMTPTFNPPGGEFSSSQSVEISTETSSATIRYTTNESDPTTDSTLYTGAVDISQTATLNAIAYKTGWLNSEIGSAYYIIGAPNAQLAKTVSGASGSVFLSVATDTSGNIYAAGSISGTEIFDFGNSITAAGSYTGNVIITKYNSSGTAQWARTVETGTNYSSFYSVATDTSGDIYAAGYIYGTNAYNFGNDVTTDGTYSANNIIIVKYNSSGTAQWAKSVAAAGTQKSSFYSVATDASRNIYAAGYIYGTGTFDFGNSQTAAGTYASGNNIVLVKYNSSGTVQWARTVMAGTSTSTYNSVATDTSGNIYVAGSINGTGIFDFGNSQTAAGTYASSNNIVLVKYNSSGTVQWARTVTAGTSISTYNSVATDTSGNIYVAGKINGTGTYDFGNSITATGINLSENVVLVKYNSSGTALWAKTVTAGTGASIFNSVAIDTSGNIYTAGYIRGIGTYNFGNSIKATGTNNYGSQYNIILVKYNSNGTTQWAKTVTAGSNSSEFKGVAIDPSGNISAAGSISGTETFNFGNTVTATGVYIGGGNILLVQYH